MTIRETLLFACANDPERILELISATWDGGVYEKIFKDEKENDKKIH